ncbi:hypothetical protein LTS08_004921 [Lithohypha guttulata]|nr:hypothetical protein LTS08_004921 [Lithohypha guttulata]
MDEEALRTERRLRQITQDGQLKEDDELGDLSATHSWIAARAIRESHRINAASAFLDYVVNKPSSPSVQPDLQTRKDELEALSLLTKSLSAQASKLRDDATMHISTIYNLIAQRDQATNLAIAAASREIALQSKIDQANSINIAESSRRIAEETKRDSNAMKMIAIVTMVYLPGTFVATCFSMDLFQWSADVPDVINPRIWVYFLFTVFLTAVTVLGFIAWMWWQERQLSRNSEEAESRDGDDPAYTTGASHTKKSNDYAALSPTRTNTSKPGLTSKTADATRLQIRHGTDNEKQRPPNGRTTSTNSFQNSLQPLSSLGVLPNMPMHVSENVHSTEIFVSVGA